MRIGVIEIGSRAVRLMIADVSREIGLKIVNTAWDETHLAAAVKIGGEGLYAKLDEIENSVKKFKESCREQRASEMCIFATAAFREMPSAFREYFLIRIPELQILDKMAEAACSLLGAINEFESSISPENQLVVDQGTGSMEVVLGHVTSTGVTLMDFKSYALGTQTLVQNLAEKQHDLKKFQSSFARSVGNYKPIGVAFEGRPVILGSVATKIAWIKVRNGPGHNYDPALAHGQIINRKVVESVINLSLKEPDTVKYLISPRRGDIMDFELFITGLIALNDLLKKLGKQQFKVSAFGTRFGVIWMLALYRRITVNSSVGGF